VKAVVRSPVGDDGAMAIEIAQTECQDESPDIGRHAYFERLTIKRANGAVFAQILSPTPEPYPLGNRTCKNRQFHPSRNELLEREKDHAGDCYITGFNYKALERPPFRYRYLKGDNLEVVAELKSRRALRRERTFIGSHDL
jgi:hypothetical protein